MNDKKERVYSEEDLCEYTILQKIDELEKQLKNIKNEFNGLYETKEEANAIHVKLRQNDAKINNRIEDLTNVTPTDLIASANKLSLGVGNAPLGNGVNLDGFTYDEATKTLKASGGGGGDTLSEISNPYNNPSKTPRIPAGTYTLYQTGFTDLIYRFEGTDKLYIPQLYLQTPIVAQDNTEFFVWLAGVTNRTYDPAVRFMYICTKAGTLTKSLVLPEVKYFAGIVVK